MTQQVPPETGHGSERLKDRVYWIVVGVVCGSIVGLTAANTLHSGDGETIAREPTPSRSVTTEGAAADMAPMDGMDHAGEPSQTAAVGVTEVGTEPLSVCRQVHDDQEQPLRDAATAMDQWAIHVGAMNQLVVGAITLPQANQFWNQTRVGAMAHLQAFATSDGKYQQRTYRCPAPAEKRSSMDPLVVCERSVADRTRVLKLARVALATWGHHVMHMEMLREGTMSPARATQLWLQSWRAGQEQIDRYRGALSTAREATC